MATLSKVERMQARTQYVQNAKVTFKNGVALVKSASSSQLYTVTYLRDLQIATSCECTDRKVRKHVCKHMEAVEHRLQQPVKVRRSAVNVALVASLQLPEGVKVRKTRKGAIGVVAPKKEVSVVCEDQSFVGPVQGPVEAEIVPNYVSSPQRGDIRISKNLFASDSWCASEFRGFGWVGKSNGYWSLSYIEHKYLQEMVFLGGDNEERYYRPSAERIERAPLSSNRPFSLLK